VEQTDWRETYHGFLWYDPFTDPGGGIGANRVWSNLPSLFVLRKPSDVSVLPAGWVRPILVTIGGVSSVVVVIAVDGRYCRDSLLERATLVRVYVGDRGVVDGRGRGGVIELVLVVEGRNLE